MEVFEGFMLEHRDVIWSVKGCYHPDGYAVAMPRYFQGRKVKTLREGMEIVRAYFPSYLRHVSEIGFEVPLVPLKESKVLNPFTKRVNDELLREFLVLFRDTGVTGSYLYLGTGNDFDLLSTNLENYQVLAELRKKGVTVPLDELNPMEVEGLNPQDFANLKLHRVLEGRFKGRPYTFKIVECEDFGEVKRTERFNNTLKVERALKPFSLPAKYLSSEGIVMTSFRTRFTEIPEGTVLKVRGFLLHRRDFLDLDLDLAEEVKILELGKGSTT
ncbi:MAG: hypothetical protein OWQ52_11235 [Metallosphaera prunae]|uniref:hypothetical protein n=1 Tax=Metallosphaera prunae TaxID=47304 RepID=UPI002274A06D|nr:hypothetical protein [Metallosphaera prunae]MCY0862977.1 hypothetical protein [Metallosphaera prunae]